MMNGEKFEKMHSKCLAKLCTVKNLRLLKTKTQAVMDELQKISLIILNRHSKVRIQRIGCKDSILCL